MDKILVECDECGKETKKGMREAAPDGWFHTGVYTIWQRNGKKYRRLGVFKDLNAETVSNTIGKKIPIYDFCSLNCLIKNLEKNLKEMISNKNDKNEKEE